MVLIGEPTCGKPYGFYPLDNCGTTYFTVQFRGVNAKNFGDYADGFVPANLTGAPGESIPGCAVADDFSKPLGDPTEARFAAALNYIENGSCPAPNVVGASSVTKPSDGKDAMANASQSLSRIAPGPALRMPGSVRMRVESN